MMSWLGDNGIFNLKAVVTPNYLILSSKDEPYFIMPFAVTPARKCVVMQKVN